MQKYFKALMADLTAYTITDVTADNDRVRCECRPRRGHIPPGSTTNMTMP